MEEYRGIWRNMGEYRAILGNIGKYRAILGNIGEYEGIFWNMKKYWVIWRILGNMKEYSPEMKTQSAVVQFCYNNNEWVIENI